jgi:hypothetical protein
MNSIFRGALACGAMIGAFATPAHALKIVLTDTGGVAGSPAAAGFRAAARYWESIITNDVTLNVNVALASLSRNTLGSAGSAQIARSVTDVVSAIRMGASASAVDFQVLGSGAPALLDGALTVVTPGYRNPRTKLGLDEFHARLDNDGGYNNRTIGLTAANAKALGFRTDPSEADARITFNSNFSFDYNAKNGTTGYDFVSIAIHEIGHALGFKSGVDDYDRAQCPQGPLCAEYPYYDAQNDWWGFAIDLFRYSKDFDGLARLNWRPGQESYFSLDGGQTVFNGNSYYSTGIRAGDGSQASHWRVPDDFCGQFIGILNPYLCPDTTGQITSNDLAVLDALGWNLTEDAQRSDYVFNAGQLSVPEPATWGMLIVGFGLIGGRLRCRLATKVILHIN